MKKLVSLLMVLVMALMAMNVTTFAVDKEVLKERAKEAFYLDVSQYEGKTNVYVRSDHRNSTVYYTTDGTKPTDKSQEASLLIKFTEPCKLRTVCYFDGKPIKYLNKTIKIKEKKPEKFTLTTKVSTGSTMVSVKKPKDSVVYYTTDGTEPTDKSEKMGAVEIFREPCKLRAVNYVDGKRGKELKQNIKIKLDQPYLMLMEQEEIYVYKLLNLPEGVKVYMTTDGSTPSAKNGKLITGETVEIPKQSEANLVCVKKGWIDSDVLTKKTGMTYEEEQAYKNDRNNFAEQVVTLVNRIRVANGLNKLTTYDKLTEVAQVRAKEIEISYSHTRPDGTKCFTALDEAGLRTVTAGENIAKGYSTPERVVDAWMNSPGHRANIRRCIELWTNPGDIVLEPFGGIGSVPYVARTLGRRAIACELKESYYRQMVANVEKAEETTCMNVGGQVTFYDLDTPGMED